MADIINIFQKEKPANLSFAITAECVGEGIWHMRITDYYDKSEPVGEVFRTVAKGLFHTINALYQQAEQVDPTPRGGIVASVLMFSDGTSEILSLPCVDEEHRKWFEEVLKSVEEEICRDLDAPTLT